MSTVGIFGLGLIGTALTERLLDAGHRVVGHDPVEARTAIFAGAGGIVAAPDTVWSAPIVLAAVFDTDQLEGVIEAAPEGTGALLVAMSTCDPDRMPGLARQAAAKSIELVEAPISGTSKSLRAGEAMLLLAGAGNAIDRLAPLLPALSEKAVRVGKMGDGNRMKLAINLVLGLNRAAVAEGIVFSEALGLGAERFLEVAKRSAASSAVMGSKGPAMVARDFVPLGRIAQSHKDFSLIRAAAEQAGASPLPFAQTYLAMMDDCLAHGEAELDNAAILSAIARTATAGSGGPA